MVIYLPGAVEGEEVPLDELTPRQIVAELDKHVVGQKAAKRAVAIALRNRIRRQKLPPEMAEEIMPKNIIMIGATGVGKTEIARRLSKLSNSPFLKVEASKFTEVGYVGRDVESMIRDLVEIAIDMVREEKLDDVADKAEQNTEERILDLLLPPNPAASKGSSSPEEIDKAQETFQKTREKLRQQLRDGKLDERIGGSGGARTEFSFVRDHLQFGRRRNGHQCQGHAARTLRPEDEEAEDEDLRSDRVSGPGRGAEA